MQLEMAHQDITVAVDGGLGLDRAGLEALIASLPGLRVVPPDGSPPPQVLVWQARDNTNDLPSPSQNTAVLLLTGETGIESLPETVTGLLSRNEPPSALGVAIRQVARGEQYVSPCWL
jgi:hypothetical protein